MPDPEETEREVIAEAYRESTGWGMSEGHAVVDAFNAGWIAARRLSESRVRRDQAETIRILFKAAHKEWRSGSCTVELGTVMQRLSDDKGNFSPATPSPETGQEAE